MLGEGEYGIGAFLNGAELEDMMEEEIFVSSPVKTRDQQTQELVMKKDFA